MPSRQDEEYPTVTITRTPHGSSIRIDHPDPFVRFKGPTPEQVRRAIREAEDRYRQKQDPR
jgi:hypothetical protein